MGDRDKLIEAMARAMCKRNYPSGTDRDIDMMWEGWEGDAQASLTAIETQGFAVVPGWQPIETCPDEGVFLLTDGVRRYTGFRDTGMSSYRFFKMEGPADVDHWPTHWIPLPAAPIQAARGGV